MEILGNPNASTTTVSKVSRRDIAAVIAKVGSMTNNNGSNQ
jgi:pseudouridine-5'-phosphate glycosidase